MENRLHFKDKSLVSALGVINRLQLAEYDQTLHLTEEYWADTQQSHQCGFVALSLQRIDKLKHATVCGNVGDDGDATINECEL